ncbi:MAG: MotA/TolQ/ExbB proton channel family protein [Pseudomonadales bacterium]|nr:MotA/TolQ/ExbB proton channel family protein [Pseudomonadales bacterium]
MDMYATVVGFFQEGGPFMYPIAIVLSIGVAIAFERYFYLAKEMRVNRKAYNELLPLLKQRRVREIVEFTKKSKSAMARIAADGVNKQQHADVARRRTDVEAAMEEGLLEALPQIERRTPYLATFANIATLLGLLGTIIGLIAAFTAVANADPAEKATLLSQSISIAMNTTAFGLMAAIPLLLIHSMLQSKTSAIIESLEIAVVKFVNLLEGNADAVAKVAAPAAKQPARA